ncbi:MAG: hypothetical protein KAQ98_07495 [Bacteriovoracaceae bacterium]|nr:hypothetical protein [Bacteriovoracaceae bacterium]
MIKILVRAPAKDEELVLSFPFLHALNEQYGAEKVSIILNEGQKNLYKFLPFPVEVHYFPAGQNSLSGIHHFCVNKLDIFNIDYYFDLENSLKSAFMGFAFRSKERIGYKRGLNRLFLTKKLENEEFQTITENDERYLRLLSQFSGKDFSNLKVIGEETSFASLESRTHVLVCFEDFLKCSFKRELTEFFKGFEEQKFVFACQCDDESGVENQVEKEFQSFISEIGGSNTYDIEKFKNSSQLIQLMTSSKVIFTNIEWQGEMASYFAIDAFVFSDTDAIMPVCKYFKSSPMRIVFNDKDISLNMEGGTRKIENIQSLLDFVHQFIVI